MENGISIYPGIGNNMTENLTLLDRAANQGLMRLFVSLYVPGMENDIAKAELIGLLRAARDKGFDINLDISPQALTTLGLQNLKNLTGFRMLGVSALRLNWDFKAEEVAVLSKNRQRIRIQLNASTITGNLLTALIQANTNFTGMEAIHNFYPRPGTGLNEDTLVRKTAMLHKVGLKVGAFVPSMGKKMGPLYDGLPTMEDHRGLLASIAARHLIALGVDFVLLGDSFPRLEEMESLRELKEDEVILHAHMTTSDPVQQELLHHSFTARVDEARDAVRAQESRRLLSGLILPENNWERPTGSITIDNDEYRRYMGELEILKYPLPADNRVNVVGYVDEDNAFLLDYITPGRKFSFIFPRQKKSA